MGPCVNANNIHTANNSKQHDSEHNGNMIELSSMHHGGQSTLTGGAYYFQGRGGETGEAASVPLLMGSVRSSFIREDDENEDSHHKKRGDSMNLRSSVVVMNQAFAQFQVGRTSSQERLTAKEASEHKAASVKLE